MEDEEIKSFTSWKLDWINALMIGVDHREFRTAVCLLQHANRETKLIMPSQQRIALLLGCSPTAVKRAIGKLVRDGWLKVVRFNRQMSNQYRFVEAKREAMVDLRQFREDEWQVLRRKSEGSETPPQKSPEGAEVPRREGAEVLPPEGAEVTPEHLKGTPEGNTLRMGMDKRDVSVGQYVRPGYVAPDFDAMEIEIQERQAKARRRERV